MNTRERLDKDFTGAIKARETFAVSTLRMFRAALKNAEIEKRSELSEEEVLDVLKREIKKVKDSLESFRSAGREDLAEKAEKELELLSRYQPAQMSDEELVAVVKEVLAGSDETNFGKAISAVMAKVGGQADGGRVSQVVKRELSSTTP